MVMECRMYNADRSFGGGPLPAVGVRQYHYNGRAEADLRQPLHKAKP